MFNRRDKIMTPDISLAELRLKNDLLEITPTKQFNTIFTIQRSDICMIQGRFQLKVTLTKSTKFKNEILFSNSTIEDNDKLYVEFFFTYNYPYEVPSCILINNEKFDFPFVCGLTGKVSLDTLTNWKTHYTLNMVINNLINTISEYEKRIEIFNMNKRYSLLNGFTEENNKRLILTSPDISFQNNFDISFNSKNKFNLKLSNTSLTNKNENEANNMLIDDISIDDKINKNQNEYAKSPSYNSNIVAQFLKKCRIEQQDNPLMSLNSLKYRSKRTLKEFSNK